MKSQEMFRAGSIALIVSTAIMLSGCGVTSAASSQQTGQHVTQKGKPAIRTTVKTKQNTGIGSSGFSTNSKTSHGALISVPYFVEGKITRVEKTSTLLNSVTLTVTKPLPNAEGMTPIRVGTVLQVQFGESLSRRGTINPKVGDTIKLIYGQFKSHATGKQVWGSNFSWYYFEKNGAFYDKEGHKIHQIHP